MSIQFKKVTLGVVGAALLAGAAGCGSDSKGGSGGETSRIAASLQDRQSELSTESLDGLWFAYREMKYKESGVYEDENYTYKGKESVKFYLNINENGDYAEVASCNGGVSDIDLTDMTTTIYGEDEVEVDNSDNLILEMKVSYENEFEGGSFSTSGKLTLFKISDEPGFPIGESVLGDVSGDVDCITIYNDEWSGEGTYNAVDWNGSGTYEEFEALGNQEIRLVRDEWEYSDEGEYLDYIVEVDGQYRTDVDGANFNVESESPLLYVLDIILDDETPALEGEIVIF